MIKNFKVGDLVVHKGYSPPGQSQDFTDCGKCPWIVPNTVYTIKEVDEDVGEQIIHLEGIDDWGFYWEEFMFHHHSTALVETFFD
jgi:hypothetical protein